MDFEWRLHSEFDNQRVNMWRNTATNTNDVEMGDMEERALLDTQQQQHDLQHDALRIADEVGGSEVLTEDWDREIAEKETRRASRSSSSSSSSTENKETWAEEVERNEAEYSKGHKLDCCESFCRSYHVYFSSGF